MVRLSTENLPTDPITDTLGHRPGKIVAVHVAYASRAAERGRSPEHPSYFLKAASSLTGPGAIGRPAGTELLSFEGEIALVIGTPAFQVSVEDAWAHVGWVTASNDLGLQDLKWADRGSNLRSKSSDGFTPVGPVLLAAADLDPGRLAVRTWLDGELVQEGTTDTLLFSFAELVADLSRTMTLDVGDVILTGTPAGASVAVPGQLVEVEVLSSDDPGRTTGRLATSVVGAPAVAGGGAPPRLDDATVADAWGSRRPAVTAGSGEHAASAAASAGTGAASDGSWLDADRRERLGQVAVATISSQLRRLGHPDASIDGVHPLVPGTRIVGTARTLRYVPFRPDLFATHGGGYNAQKRAIDTVGEGEVLVMDARRDTTAGTLGDILALRALTRGAAGIITDGSVRDAVAVAETGLPVLAGGRHPSVLGRNHVPWETDVTVACGGTTVQVGDVIVADDDGAVVVPPHLLDEVLTASEAQEEQETYIAEQIRGGHPVDGLYPMNETWRARYDAHRTDITSAEQSAARRADR
ncbi:fumarylacetoacetate hydrolase family protein [Georgenia sp. Z1344]|uniref:fumarylacetoacetate hydrolase family protein n=1 Tax=Georgenia sp. Z1344 TaxID=3416706 RepID=UPI003CF7C936